MAINSFPAILFAGPPHCGKSVLAFLLTRALRIRGIAHYLLRAVPDGEGDWFLDGLPDVVQTLRAIHKTQFSSGFVEHMLTAIQRRPLPLLVDIGGRPQGDQLGLIKACTHSILLYRTQEERHVWHELMKETQLVPLAELRSSLTEEDMLEEPEPILRGVIHGLDRAMEKRSTGITFESLLERVAGICYYEAQALEQEHIKQAPYMPINERDLAQQLSVPLEGKIHIWSPHHLRQLLEIVPSARAYAIYGRGPVWLAAALAARSLPEPYAMFDARFGWLDSIPVRFSADGVNLKVNTVPFQGGNIWLELGIPGGTLEPGEIIIQPLSPGEGVVLSGKLPRWLFAALVHTLAPDHTWLAIDDPRLARAIVVHSNVASVRPGDVLPRLAAVHPSESEQPHHPSN